MIKKYYWVYFVASSTLFMFVVGFNMYLVPLGYIDTAFSLFMVSGLNFLPCLFIKASMSLTSNGYDITLSR